MSTSPADWFLPPSDLPRTRTPAYTSDNSVEALIDGQNYFDHLALRLATLGSTGGDAYVHLCGWRISPDQELSPGQIPFSGIEAEFQRLVRTGVKVRVMLWDATVPDPRHFLGNRDFVFAVDRVGGEAILDRRVPSVGSHHQKAIVLGDSLGDWAYVGGLDICVDRWDTQQHNNSAPPRTKEFFDAWHDVQAAVLGPAAVQMWDNFADRWNDRTPLRSLTGAGAVTGTTLPNLIPDSERPIPRPFIGFPTLTHPNSADAHIQVLRTMACNQYPFLPGGEQTIRKAHEKAIRMAQHYVYIEEQYFWPCSLIPELEARAAAGVKIILVLTHEYDLPFVVRSHNHMRHTAIEQVRRGNPDNVFVFHLTQRPRGGRPGSAIYCHSKLLIVDDQFASIGTANVGVRSLTTDTELQIAVVDGTTVDGMMDGNSLIVCQFAKELRIQLWMEHLGITNRDTLVDPIVGLSGWPTAVGEQVHHAVGHEVPGSRWSDNEATIPQYLENSVMNVETTCP